MYSMNRRKFVLSSVGLAVGTSLSGCVGDNEVRPPRRSAIVNDISFQNGQLVVDVMSNPEVTTREERLEGNVGAILPIGVASAKKGGSGGKKGGVSRSRSARSRGSRSSYRSAHKSRTGHAYYYWHDDHDDWYEENEDELQQVEPQINKVAIASVPNLEQKELGAETVAWDKIKQADKGSNVVADVSDNSDWYRVGVDLERFNTDLGWEFYDVEITEDGVGQIWKVPPKL